MAANWDYKDDESGIDHYEFAIFELRHGTKRRIYPDGKYNCCLALVFLQKYYMILPRVFIRPEGVRTKICEKHDID